MDNQANKTKDQLLEDINILTDSEAKYRLMFENMINGVAYHKIVTDMEGKAVDYIFLEVNTAFEELTGLKAKEVIGKKVTEALDYKFIKIEQSIKDITKLFLEDFS